MLELAAQVSRLRMDDRRYYLAAVGVRSDGAIVVSPNGNPKEPDRKHHAEYRVCRKLNRKSTVYVCRTLADGTWANAAPCPNCTKKLIYTGVRKVIWSTGPMQFSSLLLN